MHLQKLSSATSIFLKRTLATTSGKLEGTSTGIEHALKLKEVGKGHKQDFKDYKCSDYLHFNSYSYYDKENELQQFRVPQPHNQVKDVEPKCKL